MEDSHFKTDSAEDFTKGAEGLTVHTKSVLGFQEVKSAVESSGSVEVFTRSG